MAIAARLARTQRLAIVTCAVLLGSASGLLGTAVSQAASTPAGAAPTGGRAVPQPGTTSVLNGVACPSPGDCWAVGYYVTSNEAALNQVLHWNGTRWSKVSVPDPGGSAKNDGSELYSVSCTSSRNCWAVGFYSSASTPAVELNQALHWNGRTWSSVPTPDPAGVAKGDGNFLRGVRCASSADCWAVGLYYSTSTPAVELNQALHWNGRKWSMVSVPSPGGTARGDESALRGVRCTASANCWAVGFHSSASSPYVYLNQALHWNGRRWSTVPTPDPGGTSAGGDNSLSSVACASSADCWAVGSYGTATTTLTLLNQILHWNGKRWSMVAAVPDPDGTGEGAINRLGDVACTSPAHCWAVGSYGFISSGGVGVILNQALGWNGHRWSLVQTPQPAGTADGDVNLLYGVRCASPADCSAVGVQAKSGGAAVNQALHWNGTIWSIR